MPGCKQNKPGALAGVRPGGGNAIGGGGRGGAALAAAPGQLPPLRSGERRISEEISISSSLLGARLRLCALANETNRCPSSSPSAQGAASHLGQRGI